MPLCFNSLQTGKYVARSGISASLSRLALFQFPSNGKVCSKSIFGSETTPVASCFNSLQTGKYVARRPRGAEPSGTDRFQFPSNGKVCSKTGPCGNKGPCGKFQFPSNGKVCSKSACRNDVPVSLPSFQFPSNGKVCSKFLFSWRRIKFPHVSIPFKRESM